MTCALARALLSVIEVGIAHVDGENKKGRKVLKPQVLQYYVHE